jgi:hypothetical protein
MSKFLFHKITAVSKFFATLIKLKWFFSRMNKLVAKEATFLRECLITKTTTKWLVFNSAFMLSKITVIGKSYAALVTFARLIPWTVRHQVMLTFKPNCNKKKGEDK